MTISPQIKRSIEFLDYEGGRKLVLLSPRQLLSWKLKIRRPERSGTLSELLGKKTIIDNYKLS